MIFTGNIKYTTNFFNKLKLQLTRIISLLLLCALILPAEAQHQGWLEFRFVNIANQKPIVLRDSTYINAHQEEYTISKLKYYVSNFSLIQPLNLSDEHNYQLIDVAGKTDFKIPVAEGSYPSIGFLLGIDSIKHCSGAQAYALDPMNDMFWTWNTGYVIFKLDGLSPQSSADRNRIEHHLGGYKAQQAVSTPLQFKLEQPLLIEKDKTTIIILEMDLDAYWNGEEKISIASDPVCARPGTQAMSFAMNFQHMFKVVKIQNPE